MFLLDGKQSDLNETDIARRNTICSLLAQWGLVEIENRAAIDEPRVKVNSIKILPHKERQFWNLQAKYTIGSKGTN